MNAHKYILALILVVMSVLVIAAVNEQDDGRTYFNLVQGSVNEAGSGYSTSGADTPDNVDGTGFFRLEFPVGAITDSTYTDDGMWYLLGGLGTGAGTVTSVIAGDGITTTGTTSITVSVLTTDIEGTGISSFENNLFFDAAEIGTDTWLTSSAATWTFDASGGTDPTLVFGDDVVSWTAANFNTDGNLSLNGSNQELRFYEGANYVGFEAPALSADQIWVLPDADGGASEFLQTDGGGNLTWAAAATQTPTLDDIYNNGHSATVDAGAVLWTHPTGGSGTAWNARTVRNHLNGVSNNSDGNVVGVNYIKLTEAVVGNQWYVLDGLSIDGGTTVIEEFGIETGGFVHVGLDTHGEIDLYDGQGDGTTVTLQTPADLTASWDLTLPDDDGDASEVLQTDGSGVTSWESKTVDTNIETYGFGAPDQVPSTLSTNNVFYAPVAHTGTITRIEAYVGGWTVTGAIDTLTIVVEYGTLGATATDSSVTDNNGPVAGTATVFGGDVGLAVAQNDVIGVTTTTSADDTITEVSVIITVEY